MLETKRLIIKPATNADIDTIITIESHKDNRDYLWIGTIEEHQAEIIDPNHRLWLFKTKDTNKVVGYALARLDYKSLVFELRRIAITEKNQGYGKESMIALFKYVFEDLKFNRFWLDVYPDNAIGIVLYEKLGMHKDGVLRQNYKAERGFLDQIIYSLLSDEYQQNKDILYKE